MLTTTVRGLLFSATMMTALGVAQPVQAISITFDDPITQPAGVPAPEDPDGLATSYENSPHTTPSVLDVFFTQGFAFGERTGGVGVVGPLGITLHVVHNPAGCLAGIGTNCVSNGTKFLVSEEVFSLINQTIPGGLSLSSFDASQLFQDPSACAPDCNIRNAAQLSVYGLRGGAVVAFNTFALSYGFQTFTLTDPEGDWSNLGRAVFLGTNPTPGDDAFAIDNINANAITPIPEPTTLVLLGIGLVGAGVRRHRGRASVSPKP